VKERDDARFHEGALVGGNALQTAPKIPARKSEEWLNRWVGYHLPRMTAVETVNDVALLLKFGETCVRNTFEGVSHADIFRHLTAARGGC
jgi:hypothetical protein